MEAAEQIILIRPRLDQRKSEQRAVEWHRGLLNRRRHLIRILRGIFASQQIVMSDLETRVVDRRLEDLAVALHQGCSKRFGLEHHLPHCWCDQLWRNRPFGANETPQLPFCVKRTRLLSEPYVELCTRQRKDSVT